MGAEEKSYATVVFEFIKDKLSDSKEVSDLIDKYLGPDVDNNPAAEAISDIVLTIESAMKADAGTMAIARAIAEVASEVMEIVEGLKGVTGPEKKQLVQGLLWGLYSILDRGIDGTKNRVDIPWVPTGLEEKIEKKVVYLVSDFAIEAIVTYWNKRKNVATPVDPNETAELPTVPGIPGDITE